MEPSSARRKRRGQAIAISRKPWRAGSIGLSALSGVATTILPGLSLRADIVHILGVARFRFVEWPEGCKDANDLLRTDGPKALYDLVTEGALQWPVEGLYRLNELPEPAPMTLWKPGFPEWEGKVMLSPRTLSVVTGHPGHGKTQLWSQIWFRRCQGLRFGGVRRFV